MAKAKAKNVDPMDQKRPNYVPQEEVNVPVSEEGRFPQLKLIQAISPEKVKGDDKYIKGIEEGQFLLKGDGLQEIYEGEDGIKVIVLSIRKRFVEYVPRTQGGGFVGSYDSKEEAEMKHTAGNDLQSTIDFLVIQADVDEPTPFTITFDTPTKIGAAKKWSGFFAQYKSLEGVIYKLTAKQKKNKANQAYYAFDVTPIGWVDKVQFGFVSTLIESIEQAFLPAGSEDSEI